MTASERALRAFLIRMRRAIQADRVRVSTYARLRAMEELGWDDHDIIEEIARLRAIDLLRTEHSTVYPGDRIWVFCP